MRSVPLIRPCTYSIGLGPTRLNGRYDEAIATGEEKLFARSPDPVAGYLNLAFGYLSSGPINSMRMPRRLEQAYGGRRNGSSLSITPTL